jgi:hypothetical protein
MLLVRAEILNVHVRPQPDVVGQVPSYVIRIDTERLDGQSGGQTGCRAWSRRFWCVSVPTDQSIRRAAQLPYGHRDTALRISAHA